MKDFFFFFENMKDLKHSFLNTLVSAKTKKTKTSIKKFSMNYDT